jgi:hypothetical protein
MEAIRVPPKHEAIHAPPKLDKRLKSFTSYLNTTKEAKMVYFSMNNH